MKHRTNVPGIIKCSRHHAGIIRKLFAMLCISLLFSAAVYAQGADTSGGFTDTRAKTAETYQPPAGGAVQELKALSSWEFSLSLLVLIFGMIIISLEVYLAMKGKIDADNTVKFIVVTLIITSTLFLITAGYNNNQIAPAMGLLGTIAGYLLGRQQEKKPGGDSSAS